MRRIGSRVSTLACLAMLAIHVGGVHLHAHVGDHAGEESHGIHVEQALSSQHGTESHEGHVDLSLFEPASAFANGDLAFHDTSPWIPAPVVEVRWFIPESTTPSRRFARLRPPLRAPPALV